MLLAENFDVHEIPFDAEWLRTLFRRVFHHSYSLARIRRIDEGKGYLSYILRLAIAWESPLPNTECPPQSLVLKIPTSEKASAAFQHISPEGDFESATEGMVPSEAEVGTGDFIAWMHLTECRAYALLWSKGSPPPIPIPRCYLAQEKHPSLLILEDFSCRARTPHITESLSIGQIRSLTRAIASLHAFSLTNPTWNAEGRFRLIDQSQMSGFIRIMRKGGETLRGMAVAEGIIRISDAELDLLCDSEKCYALVDPARNPFHPVIVHGDLWSNNFMFRLDEGNKLTDRLEAIIDWQGTQPGNCMEDYGRMIIACVDANLRRQCEFSMIDEYYAELESLVGNRATIPYTLADVKRWYKQLFRFGTLFLLAFVPLWLEDPAAVKDCKVELQRTLIQRVQDAIDDTLVFEREFDTK